MLRNFFHQNNFWAILILILLVIFSLLLSDFLKVKNKNREEILRKIPHIIIGVIFSLAPIFMTRNEILISAVILFFGVWAGKYSPFFKSVFSIRRISYGMWMTPLSLGIMSWIWLPKNIIPFMVGMFILAFSDAFAALVGKLWAKKKIAWTEKTFLGSFSFFLSSFLILWFFSKDFSFWKISFISFVLTLFEIILIFGLDNLFLPIISSYLFHWFLF